MKKRLQDKKGFTLVELMIVVVIMGILVAVAIPVYNSATKNTKIKSCDSNIRIIKENLNQWTMTGNNGDEVSLNDMNAIFGTAKTIDAVKTDAGNTSTTPAAQEDAATRQKREEASLIALFDKKTFPVCPFDAKDATSAYTVVCDTKSGTPQFTVTCESANHKDAVK